MVKQNCIICDRDVSKVSTVARAAWNCCEPSAQLSQKEAEYIARCELSLMNPREQKALVHKRRASSSVDDMVERAMAMAPTATRDAYYAEELRVLKEGLESLLDDDDNLQHRYDGRAVKRKVKRPVSLEELVNETADNIGYLRGPSTHKQRRGRGIE